MVSRTGSKRGMSIIRPDALICLRVLLIRYDPRSITTEGGNLKITLTNSPQKGLNYTGGLMSTWNKFCFRGGYIESGLTVANLIQASILLTPQLLRLSCYLASLVLPGTSSVYG
jgi:hypothetical protein